jgi:hypothetical protein
MLCTEDVYQLLISSAVVCNEPCCYSGAMASKHVRVIHPRINPNCLLLIRDSLYIFPVMSGINLLFSSNSKQYGAVTHYINIISARHFL